MCVSLKKRDSSFACNETATIVLRFFGVKVRVCVFSNESFSFDVVVVVSSGWLNDNEECFLCNFYVNKLMPRSSFDIFYRKCPFESVTSGVSNSYWNLFSCVNLWKLWYGIPNKHADTVQFIKTVKSKIFCISVRIYYRNGSILF